MEKILTCFCYTDIHNQQSMLDYPTTIRRSLVQAKDLAIEEFGLADVAIVGGDNLSDYPHWNKSCALPKKNFLDIADVVVPSLILGQIVGRWGNFINQEAYGYYIENSSARWFPIGDYIDECKQEICKCGGSGWHLATFFYESLWNLLTGIFLWIYKKHKKFEGEVFCLYLISYGIGRFLIEGLRTDSLYLGPFRVSQLVALVTALVGIIIIYKNRKKI